MSGDAVSSRCFFRALSFSFSILTKSLKVEPSDHVIRPRFDSGIDVSSTPSSTSETPSSWPPRPALTGLRPTCVAAHVVPFFQVRSVSAVSRPSPTINSPFTSPLMMGSSRLQPAFDVFFVVVTADKCVQRIWESTSLYFETDSLYFEILCREIRISNDTF